MPYLIIAAALLAAALFWMVKQRTPNAKSAVSAEPSNETFSEVKYTSAFPDEPEVYLSHADLPDAMAKARALNAQMPRKDFAAAFEADVVQYNRRFMKNERVRCRDIFSDIDGKSLDKQQIRAVVTDEPATLVVAGAGSGKTTTLAGKVKYLVEGRGVDPDDILLLSFTNKAADEMTERIRDRMGIPIAASTFHKLGLDIIKGVSDEPVTVFEDTLGFIRQFFETNIVADAFLCQDLLEYFSYYIHPPADIEQYKSLGETYEYELSSDLESIRSRVTRAELIERGTADLKDSLTTFKGETVKSLQELLIANFLYLHGVDYVYEGAYPHQENDGVHSAYHPDFFLPEYGIYLEHFGVNRYGKCPWLSPIEEQKYLDSMLWKRELHKKNSTVLLETYAWYTTDGVLLSRLESMLRSHGVRFSDRDYEAIFRSIFGSVSERYFSEFISLCGTFLSLFKSGGYVTADLPGLSYKDARFQSSRYHQDRTKLFKHIMQPLLEAYDKYLQETGSVDFADMINLAARYVREGRVKPHFRYILVDEYQDASVARYNLVKAIADSCGAHVMAVGDDWQAIYRFSGSDIGVFTDFAETFGGYAATVKIEQTYRNSQQLIDCASEFVLKNENQISKTLTSSKQLPKPLVFISYEGGITAALKMAMDRIIAENGTEKSVLLLGRTRYDLEALRDSGLFAIGRNSISYLENPELPVKFLTVHSAKGLEADSVILINFANTLLGFPNKISDDVLLQLVLSNADTFPYAEERRLMYVALTRTRSRTYVLTDNVAPSEFFKEFEGSPSAEFLSVDGVEIRRVFCPKCRTGHLVIRQNEETGEPFLGCSFYPKCDYTVSDIDILKRKHPQCDCGGFYVKRRTRKKGIFYGCSNYPHCMRTMTPEEFDRRERDAN